MAHENKHKHLELIQAVVARMAANSFQVKSWSVAVVSALLALSLSKDDASFATLSLFPLLVFWGLDGYYLCLEQGFRSAYNRVRVLADDDAVDYSLLLTQGERGFKCWVNATFFSPNAILHVAAIIVAGAVILLVRCR